MVGVAGSSAVLLLLPEEVVLLLVQRVLVDLARTSFTLILKTLWWLEMKGSRKARMVTTTASGNL